MRTYLSGFIDEVTFKLFLEGENGGCCVFFFQNG